MSGPPSFWEHKAEIKFAGALLLAIVATRQSKNVDQIIQGPESFSIRRFIKTRLSTDSFSWLFPTKYTQSWTPNRHQVWHSKCYFEKTRGYTICCSCWAAVHSILLVVRYQVMSLKFLSFWFRGRKLQTLNIDGNDPLTLGKNVSVVPRRVAHCFFFSVWMDGAVLGHRCQPAPLICNRKVDTTSDGAERYTSGSDSPVEYPSASFDFVWDIILIG